MKMYGRASVAGLTGTITHSSLAANSVLAPQSAQFTQNWRETVIKDPVTGKPRRFLADDITYDISIDVVFESDGSSGKNTKAIAAGAAKLTAPYQICTIAASPVTEMNDTFLTQPGTQISFTPEGDAKCRFNLRRYAELTDDEHTALATEITS